GYFNPSKLSAYTSLRQNTSLSMGQEELGFILPISASSEAKNAFSGVFRLVGLHYRSSHRKPFAFPIGQGKLRSITSHEEVAIVITYKNNLTKKAAILRCFFESLLFKNIC